MKKITKTNIILFLTVFVGLALGLTLQGVKANVIYGDICSLAVYPFDPNASEIVGAAGTPHLKYLSEQECLSHTSYPNAYQPNPPDPLDPDNTVKPGSVNKRVPWAKHEHAYFNDSPKEQKVVNGVLHTYYKKAFVDKFEITLQYDAVNNTEIPNLKCETPLPGNYPGSASDLLDCNGSDPVYGGTTVKTSLPKQDPKFPNDPTKKIVVVTWDFATSGNNTGRPPIYGINGNNFKVYRDDGSFFFLNLNDPYNRDLQFAVHMKSKNNNAEIWSATTSSRVLLRDLAIDAANYDNNYDQGCINNDVSNPNSGWCYMDPLPGYPTENVQIANKTFAYYWFPIGSVVSIWKKPPPPPPQECLNLSINPTGPFTANQLPQNINISSLTSGGLTLDYRWTATQNGVVAFDNVPFNGNPYFDTNTQTTISGLQPINTPVTLTVTAVNKANHNQAFPQNCQKTIVINPAPVLTCQSLEIYRNNALFPPVVPFGTPTDNLAAVIQKDAGLDLDLTWSATSGTFDPPPGQNPITKTNENALTTFANPSQNAQTTVTVVAREAGKGPNSPVLCQDQFVINPPPPQLVCQSLEIYRNGAVFPPSVPFGTPTDNLTAVIQKDPGLDLDLIWSATSGTFDPPPGQNPITKTNENAATTFANPAANTTTTVTVQAYNSALGPNSPIVCQDQFVINPAPLQCIALNFQINGGPASNVNNIMEGQTVTLTANPNPQPPFGFVQWQETGNGFFTNVPGSPAFCTTPLNQALNINVPSANTGFIAPANCAYQYTGAVGGQVNVSAYDPNGSNPGICVATVNVQAQPPQPVCEDLIVNPMILDQDGVTNFNAYAIFANGQPDTITLQWTASGGSFSGSNTNTLTQTQNSFQPNFQTTFFANNPFNASVDVQVAGAGSQCHVHIPAPVQPPPQCDYLNVYEQNNQLCIDVDPDYTGSFTWLYGNNPFVTNNPNYCLPLNIVEPGTLVEVYATQAQAQCNDEFQVPIPPPAVIPPTLEKYVSRENQNDYQKVVTVGAMFNNQNTVVDYKLVFTAKSPNTTAEIRDDIAYGIQGTTYPAVGTGGTIVYDNSMVVSIPKCSGPQENWTKCYTGDIGNNTLVLHKVSGEVIIRYKGELTNSAINAANCNNPNTVICQEKYPNIASADYRIYQEEQVVNVGHLEDNALVQVFCQFILARAGGDIFLESDLSAGINIRVCSIYKPTPEIIVTPAPPPEAHVPITGLPTEIFSINHSICNEGQAGTLSPELKEFFGKDVSKLSGKCEIKLTLGRSWKQRTIVQSIDENKTRISRWEPRQIDTELSFLVTLDPEAKVYRIKGANLTVDQPFTLSDGPNGGAKTFIVEDGDLIINKDIMYGTDGTAYSVNQTASMAFIVLNGKVIVSPEVKTLSGVYFVQEGDRLNSGRLFSGSVEGVDSYEPLTVYGSVYGDIDPLFRHRLFAGDPGKEESSMLIRFDQRIILNTPPVLKDVLNVSQVQVAN